MFVCEDIYHEYANGKGIFGINLSIRTAGIVALVGRNGSGKTTLLNLMAGITVPKSGRLSAFGKPIDPGIDVAYKSRLAYCPAGGVLIENLSVRENFELVSYLRCGDRKAWKLQEEWISRFDCGQFLDTDAGELSEGQRRRCMILTTLFGSPDIIMLDEPGNDLDIEGLFVLQDLLSQLAPHKAVIVSTHIIDVVRHMPVRAVFMEAGTIVLDENLGADEKLEDLYRHLIWGKEKPSG